MDLKLKCVAMEFGALQHLFLRQDWLLPKSLQCKPLPYYPEIISTPLGAEENRYGCASAGCS